ncbi:hypothetical protein [Kitasatospora sp. NPDC059673]|uniref:hypothetical protein n=1 Tax=Kitasatospora sp. NPDC059673 TaxID=3346901 RepID=UPI0036BA67D0
MTTAQLRLHHALDALDAAGSTTRPGPPVHGCEHCWTAQDFALLTGPADLVPNELLRRAAMKSWDLWDDFPTLYRRLAPRILREFSTGRLIADGPLIASRLLTARWREWPHAELVTEVLDAWWSATLEDPEPPRSVPEVLETVATTTGTLTPWLRTWADTATVTADRHLADALERWLPQGEVLDLKFGFYGELEVGAELTQWLLSLPPGRIGADQRYWLDLVIFHCRQDI